MSSAQDLYAGNLQQTCGFPLYSPEPRKQLPEPYPSEGFKCGDVGYINREGEFTPLFNIRLPPWDPCDAPSYEPAEFSEHSKPFALPKGQVFMSGVKRDVDAPSPASYKFVAKSKAGAILILPSGATLVDLDNKDLEKFRQIASKYAREWCQIWKDDSLYLVTGLYKTRNFTLASFNSGDLGGKLLVEQQGTGTYEWKCAFQTYFRAGPQNNNYENQTVLIKGFRMTMRWSWLAVIEQVTGSQPSIMRWFASLCMTLLALLETMYGMAISWLSRTTIEPTPRLSQPIHPSDIINRYLLDKNPGASVAITHDNEWIDMLEKKRLLPEDLVREDRFRDFLEKEYTLCSVRDVIYLQSQIGHTDDTSHDNSASSRLMSKIENVQIVITHIRAENLAVGLKRIPVGFYVQVDIPGRPSRRTEIKSMAVHDRVVQWDDLIHLYGTVELSSSPYVRANRSQAPPDSSVVKLTVSASFEFDPMLGRGELLHTLETSVGELLHRTHPFTFSDKQEEDGLPCASFFVAVQQWHCNRRPPGSNGVDDTVNREEFIWQVTEATENGHDALLRYHEDYCEENLQCSVTHFERALACCPEESPHRAAALFNLATAEFMTSQSHRTSYDFNKFIPLYREALRLRRDDHRDRPMTLLHLAQAILHRYMLERYAVSTDELCKLVGELKNICPEGTHARRAAELVFQTYERLRLVDSDDLDKLTDLISELDAAAQEPLDAYFDRPIRFNNLGLALQRRFQLHREAGLGDLDKAIEWLEKAVRITPENHPCKTDYVSNLGNALLIHRCEALYDQGRIIDAVTSLLEVAGTMCEDAKADNNFVGWLFQLAKQCTTTLERLGDKSFDNNEHDKAIKAYTTALSLGTISVPLFNLNDHMNILIKRSKARALLKLWDDALSDANEATKLDPSSYRGYEMRHAVLRGAKRYSEAVEAFDAMLSKLKSSPDKCMRKVRSRYVDARYVIREAA